MKSYINSVHSAQTYAIIGAAMEVHRVLGHGFLEHVYQEALAVELERCNIPFVAQQELPVRYKDQYLSTHYRADFVVYNQIILEIKAMDQVSGRERAQLLNYLKASGYQRGLLINFGARSLEHERQVWQYQEQ